jgi:peptide deformylase
VIRKILKHPNPLLRQVSANVRPEANVASLIRDLRETARESRALGLAAVQIGFLLRVCVILVDGVHYVPFINPEILQSSGVKRTELEECLSIPWAKVKVQRSLSLVVRSTLPDGTLDTQHLQGMTARALQHEIDHMNGVLITDYKREAAHG